MMFSVSVAVENRHGKLSCFVLQFFVLRKFMKFRSLKDKVIYKVFTINNVG